MRATKLRNLAPLALAVFLGGPAAPAEAGSWLTGRTPFDEAVAAVAAGRYDEAARLAAALPPEHARGEWLRELLEDRREADLGSRYSAVRAGDEAELRPAFAVSDAYAYHNLYLFLRAEGVEPALLEDARRVALEHYAAWISPDVEAVKPSLRWAYGAMLFEADRPEAASEFLAKTKAAAAVSAGVEGPRVEDVGRYTVGFLMLAAYYHTARGDADAALAFLRAAADKNPRYVRRWAARSDDFWALRGDLRFKKLLGE